MIIVANRQKRKYHWVSEWPMLPPNDDGSGQPEPTMVITSRVQDFPMEPPKEARSHHSTAARNQKRVAGLASAKRRREREGRVKA